MKQKTEDIVINKEKLTEVITSCGLNQRILAKSAGIAYSSWKNKFNVGESKYYYFSQQEFAAIVHAIEQYKVNMSAFIKFARATAAVKTGTKSKILFQKKQVAPFILSHQFETLDEPKQIR